MKEISVFANVLVFLVLAASSEAVTVNYSYEGMTAEQQAAMEFAAENWEMSLLNVSPTDWTVDVTVRWASFQTTDFAVHDKSEYCWSGPAGKADVLPLAHAWITTVDRFDRPTGGVIEFNSAWPGTWFTQFGEAVPATEMDFFSVAAHELGHVLGYIKTPRYQRNVTTSSDGKFIYNANGFPTITLFDPLDTASIAHVDAESHPNALMQYSIDAGTRRFPTDQETAVLNHDVWRSGANEFAIDLVRSPAAVVRFQPIYLTATVFNGNNGLAIGETVIFMADGALGYFENSGTMNTSLMTDGNGNAAVIYIPSGECYEQVDFTATLAVDPAVTASEPAFVQGCPSGSILVTNLHQIPEQPLPGDNFVIVASVSYADGTPFSGGEVELVVDGVTTTTVFSGSSFTTTPRDAPDQSQMVAVRVFEPGRCCREEVGYFLAVDEQNSVTITRPLPGDRWGIGTTQSVCWNFSSAACRLDIEISRNGGASWEIVGSSATGDRCNELTVAGPPSANAYFRVTCQSDPSETAIVGPIELYELGTTLAIGHTISGSVSNDDVDQGMAFSPDGKYLAVRQSANAGQIAVYDTRTYQRVSAPFPSIGCFATAFSPNSRMWLPCPTRSFTFGIWKLRVGAFPEPAPMGEKERESPGSIIHVSRSSATPVVEKTAARFLAQMVLFWRPSVDSASNL